MHVAIVGDGVGGRTLYRILKTLQVEADLYGRKRHTKCKIRPCGYGTSASCVNLLERLGVSPDKYVLRYDDYIIMDGRKIKGDLYWIDKPQLLRTITTSIQYDKPHLDNCDLVVDATGIDRAYSPQITEFYDKQVICYQHRIILNEHVAPAFDTIRGGYLWTIPLGEKEAHIGGGSSVLESGSVEKLVLRRVQEMNPSEIICSCCEPIRVSGPILPLVSGRVVTIGEAAGLVVPFGGAGIQTTVESAVILANTINKNNIKGYDRVIMKRFGWLVNTRKIIDRLEKGRLPFFSLSTSYRALRYQGLKPTLMDLLHIRKSLVNANK
jgi:flavin-dependent dehydrogenase